MKMSAKEFFEKMMEEHEEKEVEREVNMRPEWEDLFDKLVESCPYA